VFEAEECAACIEVLFPEGFAEYSRRCAVVAQLDTHTARTVLGHDG